LRGESHYWEFGEFLPKRIPRINALCKARWSTIKELKADTLCKAGCSLSRKLKAIATVQSGQAKSKEF
jgi:hypothetical protein